MRKNKLFVMLVAIIIALSAMMMVACPDEPEKVPGPETGSYYCEVGGTEYTVSLFDADRFAESTANGPRVGTYVLNGSELTLTYPVKEKGAEPETKVGYYDSLNRKVTLPVDGVQREYLEIKSFDVTFNLYDDRTETQTVKNGKSVLRPEDPIRDGYEFMGWYTAKEGGERYQFNGSMILSAGTTVYARWRPVSTQKEFVIDFDLGYEATAPAAVNTVNGKLFDIPSDPTREGYTFAGWWISDYEDGAKLTVKYEEGREFKANTTLFAVWTANGNEQPVVSVNGSGISWAAKNGTVKVTVKGPKGFTALEQDVNGQKMAVNFGSAPAGDYEITVIDGSKSTTVYYRNKALDRVSRFSVDGSVLRYDGVANATRYYVSVVCGNEKHNHAYIDNDNKLYFDFTDCTMVREGIKFVVTAHADGYADSVSEEYVCIKELAKVEGFAYDKASGKLSWNSVENARSYVITVNGKATALTVNEYSFKGYAKGEYEIKVSAFAKGYAESVASEYSLVKNELSTPSNVKLANSVLSWDGVEGAQNYTVRVGNTEYEAEGTSYDLSGIVMVEAQDYEIVVRANAASASENSAWSDVLDARYHALKDSLTYRENTVRWTAVIGAEKYEVKVNNGAAKIIEDGSVEAVLTLTKRGINEITVRYYDGMRWSKTVSVEVVAYMVRFDARNDESVKSVYVAVGDRIFTEDPVKEGHNFIGWYNTYDGAESNGSKYEEAVFSQAGDMVLYAGWQAKTYTVALYYNSEALKDENGNPMTVNITYGQRYYIAPVPAPGEGMVFAGWYYTSGGENALTDVDGNSFNAWRYTGTDRVYAYFSSNVFAFTYETSTDTYAVAKGSDIARFTKITIPAKYNGKDVRVISANAFKSCSHLKEVNIPNTIEVIERTAFDSCTKLEAYNVYDAGKVGARYSSDNGVLLATDVAGKEIFKYPVARDGNYEIPYGIVRIPEKTFYNATKLTHVAIPVTVSFIGQSAFYGCSALEAVSFLESDGGEIDAGEIAISKYAFQNCKKLTSINLPARLTQFASNIFSGCTALSDINIDKNCANYQSINGMVTSADGKTLLYCSPGKRGEVRIPNSIESIETEAFKYCNYITKLSIAASVTSMGNRAFYGCSELTTVHFEGAQDAQEAVIGYQAFERCYKLSSVLFDDDVNITKLDKYAFEYCTALKSITLPASLVKIDNYALGYCSLLSEVKFAEGTVFVDVSVSAFEKSLKLTKIYIPSTMEDIPTGAINACPSIEAIIIDDKNPNFLAEGAAIYSKDKTIIYFYSKTGALPGDKLELPETVEVIKASVFNANLNVKTLVIGANVTAIEDSAFEDATNLESIEFKASEKQLMVGEKVFKGTKALTTVTISSRIVEIGNSMFMNSGLTSVTFEAGLEKIGNSAFAGCVNLSELTFNGEAVIKEIGSSAFSNSKLTTFAMPDTVTLLGASAFSGATSLSTVTFGENSVLKEIGARAFEKTGLVSIELPASLEKMGTYMFASCTKLDCNPFAKCTSMTEIPDYTFNSCTGLTSFVIKSNIKKVGNYAFASGTKLATVTFEAGGTEALEVGNYAFSACSALTTVKLPSRLEILGNRAFQNCTKMNAITFTDKDIDSTSTSNKGNLKSIGDYCFLSNGFLKIDIPDSVEYIGQYAFEKCTKLTAITIPAMVNNKAPVGDGKTAQECGMGISSVGKSGTFDGCTKLATVTFLDPTEEQKEKIEHIGITLGDGMFNGCTSLKTVVLPARMEDAEGARGKIFPSIEPDTFKGCKNIVSISMADGGEHYSVINNVIYKLNDAKEEEALIYAANKLAGKVTVPYTVRSIMANSFSERNLITEIEFEATPEGKTEVPLSIEDGASATGAFFYMLKLKSITLPERLVYIGKYAFYQTQIASLNIPKNVRNSEANPIAINSYALADSSSKKSLLKTVTFENNDEGNTSVLSLAGSVFQYHKNLTSVTLPDCLVEVGTYFFYNSTITKVNLPKSLKKLGNSAFYGCTKLTEVTFEEGTELESLSSSAFSGCTSLKTVTYPKTKAIAGSMYSTTTAITKVILPANFTEPIANMFNGATKITAIEVVAGNTALKAVDGVLYTIDSEGKLDNLVYYPVAKAGASYAIPDGVRGVGTINVGGTTTSTVAAFTKNDNLESITVPASVQSIGSFAFANSVKLKYVKFEPTKEGEAAKDLTFGDYVFYTCKLLEGSEAGKPFVIPARTAVGGIGPRLFEACAKLTKVEFESGTRIEEIPARTFYNTALTEFTIPKSVTVIGEYAFYGNEDLNDLKLEAGGAITSIASNAFYRVGAISPDVVSDIIKNATVGSSTFSGAKISGVVTIPNGVSTIGSTMFQNNAAITKVILSDTVTAIGNNAFQGCTSLKEVVMSKNITSIGQYAFAKTAISRIELPDSLNTLGNYAFSESSIEEVNVPASVTSFGTNMFSKCASLKRATINCSVVNNNTFFGCLNLAEVELSEGVQRIGDTAFSGCSALKEITIPSTVCNNPVPSSTSQAQVLGIGKNAFKECTSLESITFAEGGSAGLTLAEGAFTGCSSLTAVDFTERLVNGVDKNSGVFPAIGKNAFSDCTSLAVVTNLGVLEGIGDFAFKNAAITEIKLPAMLTYYGTSPFMGCPLTKIDIEDGNQALEVKDGILYDKSLTKLLIYPIGLEGEVSIPDSVEEIGEGVFAGSGISDITLPSSLTEVGAQAFKGCKKLTRVVLPEGCTAIGASAFTDCPMLESINIVDCTKMTSIGDYAFKGCSKLVAELPASLEKIGIDSFRGTSIKTAFISNKVTSIGANAFMGCVSLTTLTFENGGNVAITIGDYAFSGCTGIQSVVLPWRLRGKNGSGSYSANLPALGNYAFSGCTSLKTVSAEAQYDNTLSNYYYMQYGNYCFEDCVNLVSVDIHPCIAASSYDQGGGGSNTSYIRGIGAYAFKGCKSLERVTFPETTGKQKIEETGNGRMIRIGNYAFAGCAKLSDVNFHKNTFEYGDYSFSGTAVTKVVIYGHDYYDTSTNSSYIREGAFKDCKQLVSAEFITENVHLYLYKSSFEGCSALETVKFSGTDGYTKRIYIKEFAFKNCTSLASVTFGVLGEGDAAKCCVYSIERMAFGGCTSLSSLNIPKDVVASDNIADVDTEITYEEGSNVEVENGIVYNKGKTTVIRIPTAKINEPLAATATEFEDGALAGVNVDEYVIPAQITKLGYYVFSGSSIKKITVPKTITYMSYYAFADCKQLEEVTFEEGSSLTTIGNYTFMGCTSLKKVKLHSGVTTISIGMFKDCTSLASIDIPESVTKFDTECFMGCTSLSNITISDKITYINKNAFANCTSLTYINIPESVTTVNEGAFMGSGLKTVIFGAKVLSMSKYMFKDCKQLTSVTIVSYNDRKITSLSEGAFMGCTSLTGLTLPANLTAINKSCFEGCTSLTELALPDTISTVGEAAFKDCASLKSMDFSATKLGNVINDSLFEGCTSLETVILKSNVVSIYEKAFKGCVSIKELVIEGSILTLQDGAFDGWTATQTIRFNGNTAPTERWTSGWNSGCKANIVFAEVK